MSSEPTHDVTAAEATPETQDAAGAPETAPATAPVSAEELSALQQAEEGGARVTNVRNEPDYLSAPQSIVAAAPGIHAEILENLVAA